MFFDTGSGICPQPFQVRISTKMAAISQLAVLIVALAWIVAILKASVMTSTLIDSESVGSSSESRLAERFGIIAVRCA